MEDMDTSDCSDPLLSEFTGWQTEPSCSDSPEKIISLKKISRTEDGKATIIFIIDKNQHFTLYCPLNYPNYQEENFFIEAEPGLQLWCNALNEYILDSTDTLSLSCILNKSLSLYSTRDSRNRTNSVNMMDSEDEEDDDGSASSGSEHESDIEDAQLDDMLDKDFNTELLIARRRKRWKAKEEELRAESRNGKCADQEDSAGLSLQEVYHDPSLKNSQPKQVFTSAAASGILINDLVAIMQTRGVQGVVADTVDDNIFQWNVKLSNFQGTKLNEDLMKVNEEFGYDYIELQLDFSMDLYPFFPPLVKVIRPRLQGSMMLRVTTMEILKLTYWDPARDMKSVLTDIRNFLSTWARLDMHSERNDKIRYPNGAYIDIEHHLLRLALVSEIVPRANHKYVSDIPSPVRLPPTAVESRFDRPKPPKKDEKKEKTSKLFGLTFQKSKTEKKKKDESPTKKMAKGIGYSSYNNKGWDVKAFMAAQLEKDKQIELVLEKILLELKRIHIVQQSLLSRNLPDLISDNPGEGLPPVDVNSHARSNSSRRKRKHSPDDVAAQDELAEDGPINPLSDLYAVLEGSALIPFIESKLQSNSFLEIGRHPSVYRMLVGIIKELSTQSTLLSLLGPLPDQKNSIHFLLQNLEQQAKIMISRIGKASANGSVPKAEKGKPVKNEDHASASGGDNLAKEFLLLSNQVTQALKNTCVLPEATAEGGVRTNGVSTSSQSVNPIQPDQTDDNLEAQYIEALKPYQFTTLEFPESGKHAHFFQSEYSRSDAPSFPVICRVAQDISSLASQGSLPLNLSSSLFVRSDDDKSTLLKAIITGPEGTPYTGGVYEFDIYFPSKYPHSPPKVQFRTTGNGSVRFNPNLYQDGKVCLSLLGTWEGAQGEQWNHETSTILQVLISIQSLILVPEPYYNEPGFERHYGTTTGNTESMKYSEDTFKNNLKFGILEQLSSPPLGFEEVVRLHFYIRRNKLIQEIERMGEEYGKGVKKLVSEVVSLLQVLEKPASLNTH
ncbi:uncharacterized protein LOC111706168 [Eurytemora carolleeae]|uniref:uncharacterized protein LOC111706168 n=1 Tax=Eurytemora carolleeae TaxID=1294199 RepID=UPI000C78891B|nr:uncharacterized protein LOC111706168 [Eurytemora carolleeae]|eukprot:XP_023334729.1 uncharacterized protein LOC111706168 [Eurytemora affinis]